MSLATKNNLPNSWDGIAAILFYLCVYTVATIGTFAMFEFLGQRRQSIEAVDDLSGLAHTRPGAAAMIAVFMFSLTGIPPLAGFWGKLYLFASALNVNAQSGAGGNMRLWFVLLAILGVLNAAISAGYYLRIVSVMYFRGPEHRQSAEGGLGAWTAAVACAVVTIIIGFYPAPLIRVSNRTCPDISQLTRIERTLDIRMQSYAKNAKKTTASACPQSEAVDDEGFLSISYPGYIYRFEFLLYYEDPR